MLLGSLNIFRIKTCFLYSKSLPIDWYVYTYMHMYDAYDMYMYKYIH